MIGQIGIVGQLGVLGGSGFSSNMVPVTYTVDDGDTVKIGLGVKSGSSATIDWGDGTLTDVTNSGGYQYYSHDYVDAGTYSGRIIGASQVTHLWAYHEDKMQFDITSFRSLIYLTLYRTNGSITGDVTGMHLTYMYVDNKVAAVTGDISGMALTYLTVYGEDSTISGTLSHESRLTREYVNISNYIALPEDRIYGEWGSESMIINMSGHKLTADETDATLIQMAAATISGSNKTVYIYGEDRTSASDDAMNTLTNAGVTVTITG